MRAALVSIIALICTFSALSFGQETPSAADREAAIAEMHQTLLDDDNLQFERPIKEPGPEAPPRDNGNWMRALADALSGVFRVLGFILSNAGPYIVLAAALGIVLFLLRELGVVDVGRIFQRNKAQNNLEAERDVYRPDEQMARNLLADADALAAEGRYSEAVHSLLFRSIEDLKSRRGTVEAFLTAREIGALTDLLPEARTALTVIIELVEDSYFGGAALGHDGWTSARAAYEAFAFGGGPA